MEAEKKETGCSQSDLNLMDDKVGTGARQFAFLPWLRLKEPCRIGGVEFLPWRDKSGSIPDALGDSAAPLAAILSGYVDHKAEPIDNCVVITLPSRGWNLADSDFESVRWATALLEGHGIYFL